MLLLFSTIAIIITVAIIITTTDIITAYFTITVGTDAKRKITALPILAKALKLNPASNTSLHIYAEALMTANKHQDALLILQNNLKYQNTSYLSYLLLGTEFIYNLYQCMFYLLSTN